MVVDLGADEALAPEVAHGCDVLSTWPDLPKDWMEGVVDPPDEGEGALRVADAIRGRVGQIPDMFGNARLWRLELGAWCGLVPDGRNVRTVVGTAGVGFHQREWTPDCDADVIAEDVAGRLVFAEPRGVVTASQKELLRRLAAHRMERIAARFDAEFGRQCGAPAAWNLHGGRGAVALRFVKDRTGVEVRAHGTNALGERWEEEGTSEVGTGPTEVAFLNVVIERIRAASA